MIPLTLFNKSYQSQKTKKLTLYFSVEIYSTRSIQVKRQFTGVWTYWKIMFKVNQKIILKQNLSEIRATKLILRIKTWILVCQFLQFTEITITRAMILVKYQFVICYMFQITQTTSENTWTWIKLWSNRW